MINYTCPVCGYPELDELPRDDESASYDICPSCGFQFGVSDDNDGYTYERWRQEWVEKGTPWSSVGIPRPADWNPVAQMRDAPPRPG